MFRRLILFAAIAACVVCGTKKKALAANDVDLVVVYKKERLLVLYKNGRPVSHYDVALGFEPDGDKHFEGDGKTPEGSYKIIQRRVHPTFHKSLKISYPNKADIEYAKKMGRSPGGEILIHGLKNEFAFVGGLHDWLDWTQGCVAVTNNEMDEIYDLVQVGTPVWIFKDFKSSR